MYATERKQRKVTFLGIPRFTDLAEMFRNHRVRYMFYVPVRGVCIAYIRDDDKDAEDPWHIRDNRKMKQLAFGKRNVMERSIDEILRVERKLPNYWFDFTFDALPTEKQEQYDALVAKYKAIAGLEEDEKTKETKSKRALKAMCTNLFIQGLTTEEIADLSKNMEYDCEGITYQTVNAFIFDTTKTPLETMRKTLGLKTKRGGDMRLNSDMRHKNATRCAEFNYTRAPIYKIPKEPENSKKVEGETKELFCLKGEGEKKTKEDVVDGEVKG